jgi:hypothetical protein
MSASTSCAVSVTADQATCPCGEVIAFADPDDPPPVLCQWQNGLPTAIGRYHMPQV